MSRIDGVFVQCVSFANLYGAFKKAYKATKKSSQAKAFLFNLERELLSLHSELMSGAYVPGTYRVFRINDPKPRTISVAPFRDRVVHHALVNILEPVYEKTFIADSYASRKGKGTHRAVVCAQRCLRRTKFFAKTDISKYFDSIDHGVLLALLRKRWKDQRLLALIERILENFRKGDRGLPIGNLTSQFFANVYLDPLDHYLKDFLGVKHYIRYMDDFVIFAHDREETEYYLREASRFVSDRLSLTLKEKGTFINRSVNGLPFLGMNIYPGTIRIQRERLIRSLRKVRKRERKAKASLLTEEDLVASVQSIWSRIVFADTYRFRRDVIARALRE